jgi:hypothetical protein
MMLSISTIGAAGAFASETFEPKLESLGDCVGTFKAAQASDSLAFKAHAFLLFSDSSVKSCICSNLLNLHLLAWRVHSTYFTIGTPTPAKHLSLVELTIVTTLGVEYPVSLLGWHWSRWSIAEIQRVLKEYHPSSIIDGKKILLFRYLAEVVRQHNLKSGISSGFWQLH